MEKVCYMLSNAGLPKSFWAEVASTACLLINRSPSVVIDKKTLQEVWSSTPASIMICGYLDVLRVLMLIMESLNLDLLSVYLWVINLVLKVIRFGVQKAKRL